MLISPTDDVRRVLRSLADAYTLMAFLRETPDVQSAVVKMFSQGDIWLDTSVILPLFTEQLQVPETKKFIVLVRAATEAGLKLHITPGILQEIERHFNICLTYSRMKTGWIGRIPFLYAVYMLGGRRLSGFSSWVENFRGDHRPEDDIANHLKDIFQIEIDSLDNEVKAADVELRYAAERIWTVIHEKRRTGGIRDLDEITARRLMEHDAENMVGVLYRQSQEHRASAFGYENWLITLDRSAPEAYRSLHDECPTLAKSSPLMSPDFLLNYLAFGPVRRRVSKATEAGLPIFLGSSIVPILPQELIEIADRVRRENAGLPEHILRRRVRDDLDKARLRIGPIALGGLDDVDRAYSRLSSDGEVALGR